MTVIRTDLINEKGIDLIKGCIQDPNQLIQIDPNNYNGLVLTLNNIYSNGKDSLNMGGGTNYNIHWYRYDEDSFIIVNYDNSNIECYIYLWRKKDVPDNIIESITYKYQMDLSEDNAWNGYVAFEILYEYRDLQDKQSRGEVNEVKELKKANNLLIILIGRLLVELDNHKVIELSDILEGKEKDQIVELLLDNPRVGYDPEEQDYEYINRFYE